MLWGDAIDALAPAATFTIAIAENLPTLEANRLSLFQVFLNLVGNGIIITIDRMDRSRFAPKIAAIFMNLQSPMMAQELP